MRAAPDRAHAKRPPRTAPLALILTVGILAAAVVVTDAMVVVSMRGRTPRFAAPLHVYPVKMISPGLCPPTTPGIDGQGVAGPSCFQVGEGISIRRANDIHIQTGSNGRSEIAISLLPPDKRAFANLTQGLSGRQLAFVVGNRLVTAPRVETPITQGKIIISGEFTRPDAERLMRELTGSSVT